MMSKEKQIEEMAKITANAIEKKVCEKCEDCKWNGSGSKDADCTDYICAEALYNAGYRKQEWISVEERLPDEQGRYLIVDKEGQMNTAFYTPRFGWFSHFRIKNITHWMPLPEAPKMKGGAE